MRLSNIRNSTKKELITYFEKYGKVSVRLHLKLPREKRIFGLVYFESTEHAKAAVGADLKGLEGGIVASFATRQELDIAYQVTEVSYCI